jgi:hypothetical protein
VEIQGYCDKKTQYRNTSVIHHASDLAFEPIDLDGSYQEVAVSRLSLHHTWMVVFYDIAV